MSVQERAVEMPSGRAFDPQFLRKVNAFTRDLALIEAEIPPGLTAHKEDTHHRHLLEACEVSIDACQVFETEFADDPKWVAANQKFFRDATDPWFRQSWFAHRARSKPSGFAGDYDMLCKIYGDAIPSTGIGAYLDLMFLDLPLACAVRGRLAMAREFLLDEVQSRSTQGKAVRILDIASGPCREYMDWPSQSHPIDVVAIDNDPNAIQYVQTQIAPGVQPPSRLENVSYNAFRTRSAETTIRKFGRFDILYSVGLCDYLTDDVLVKLLSAWDETLSEDGVMCIAFKDTKRYDQTIYQWHLDWFFYQRTVQDVFELYEKAGFDLGSIATRRDSTGVITNFMTRRNTSRIRRMDAAEPNVRRPTLRLFAPAPVVIHTAPGIEGASTPS